VFPTLQVVLSGADVIRTIGVEQGGDVLELAAIRSLLERAVAVQGYSAGLALVVGV
jgi:hypothetical protein